MLSYISLSILSCVFLHTSFSNGAESDKRPFYIIGHMVNSIRQVKHYLDRGANSLESDIQFNWDGSVKEVYHGFPCDCFRTCTRSVDLPSYLKHVRQITDPKEPDSYYKRMVLQFLDLKLNSSNNKRKSGREIASHILDYLWTMDGSREQEVKVLVYIEAMKNKDFIHGFLEEFKERAQEPRLKDVGFDSGQDDLFAIRNMFEEEFKGELNVWQGDGKSNCFSAFYPDGRLRRALGMRDSRNNNYVSKVYHWTIDLKIRIRLSMNMGVDGFITNDPEDVVEVLKESYYRDDYRLATPDDNPFVLFKK